MIIQRLHHNPQLLLHRRAQITLPLLNRTLKSKGMDIMSPIMMIPILQIGHQFMRIRTIHLERFTGGKMDIANDFVDFDAAGDVTAFL